MGRQLWRGLVFFFTRPIRFSDLSALGGRIKARRQAALEAKVAAVAAPIEVPVSRPSPMPARERKGNASEGGRVASASMFRPELEVGVSEQPIDTLPAELRDELQRPPTGGMGARPRQG